MGLFRRRATIKFSTLRSQSAEYKADLVRRFAAEALPAFSGPRPRLSPVISKVLSIAEVAQAHAEVEANVTVGKIALTFDA